MKTIIKITTISIILMGLFIPSLSFAKTEPLVLPTNTFIKYEKRPAVYYIASDGRRYEFPNEQTYYTWKKDFSNIKIVSYSELRKIKKGKHTITVHPGVKLIKFPGSSKVYAVSSGAELRWITSESVARELYGTDWAKEIITLPLEDLENYVFGEDINEVSDYDRNHQINSNYFIDRELKNRDYLNPLTKTKASVAASSNLATLKSLRENLKDSLSPRFKPEITSYTIQAKHTEEEVTLKPYTKNKNAKIYVNGTAIKSGMEITLKLNEGNNYVTITVKQGSKTLDYSVNIKRQTAEDVNLDLKYLKENLKDSLSPKFDPNVTHYTIDAKYSESILNLIARAKDKDTKISINGHYITPGKKHSIQLEKNENKIKVVVHAGREFKTYHITVNKSKFKSTEDAQLKYVRTSLKNDMTPDFSPEARDFYLEANENENSARISVGTVNRYAEVWIDGENTHRKTIKLHGGNNRIKIQSYSPEGVRVTYYLNITK